MKVALAEQLAADKQAVPKAERLVSLDVFRGITIAGMMLVNNPGSWSYVYPPLAHAEWDGWTPTDLIFPFFVFIVGVAMTFSLGGKVERGTRRAELIPHILRRSATLFALGLFLSGFPFFHLSTIRIPGVLQRIAVCYLVGSLIFLFTSARAQAIIATLLIGGYWAIMKLVPVPAAYVEEVIRRGQAENVSDLSLYVAKNANVAAYVDNTLLHGHLWGQTKTWDPEGILSTIPAVATVLVGVLVGHWLRADRGMKQKTMGLLAAGALAVALGQVMNIWFPINKNLWTSSYVIFTAGMACVAIGVWAWIIDVKGSKAWAQPFITYGLNPLTAFIGSGAMARVMGMIHVNYGGESISLQQTIYRAVFASWLTPINASLAYAICFVALWYGILKILERRNLILRV